MFVCYVNANFAAFMEAVTYVPDNNIRLRRTLIAVIVTILLSIVVYLLLDWWAVMIVSISAGIGWGTNFLAVKMLFHPKDAKKIGFIEIQGVFPKRQQAIAENVARVVAEDLIAIDEIKEIVMLPRNIDVVQLSVKNSVNEFLEHKMTTDYPLLSLLLSRRLKEQMRDSFLREVELKLPGMIYGYMNHFENEIDLEKMISSKFQELSVDQLETIMYDLLREEFRFIEYVGLTIGLIIGTVQVFITWLFLLS